MCRPLVFAVLLLWAVPGLTRDKVENWVEVRSEHFIVATDSSEKQGRKIADQFERMRSVFHMRFPKLQIDPAAPIFVLAAKDEKAFRALEPESYLAKGQLKLGGLFLRAPDKNYVLMRTDAEGEHPYEVVYHEYTHLLLGKAADWLPLWLEEGLAEFYQNTEIRDKEVLLGQLSDVNIGLLRQNRPLPLATLFTVDHSSPYYHEENKGSIFYAESWALVHYIQVKDYQENAHRLTDYVELLSQHVDTATAATRAFGDLKQLESTLHSYIGQERFTAFKMRASTQIDEATFQAEPLTAPQADALRADFLAYNQRTADARTLLDRILKDDPNNVTAHETMGFLAFQNKNLEEARKWYAEAVQLDSKSYLAHYYFAAISMMETISSSDEPQIENSLRTAIKLNPSFAPTYDRLAAFLAMRHRNLEEAHMMGLTAVSLEPENVNYRINVANVLLSMQQGKNAVAVLQAAAKLAKAPQEVQMVDNFLSNAQAYAQTQADQQRFASRVSTDATVSASTRDESLPQPGHPDNFVAKGPHRFVVGVLKNIHCDPPQMELTVDSAGKSLRLQAENYYKIQFTALNFSPSGNLNPCEDLEGRPAKVEYLESADQSVVARVLGVELHK